MPLELSEYELIGYVLIGALSVLATVLVIMFLSDDKE